MGGEGAGQGINLWAVQLEVNGQENARSKTEKQKLPTINYSKREYCKSKMTHKNEQAEVSQLKHARRQHYTGKLTVNTQTTDETTANHSRTGTGHTNSTTGLKCQN